MISLAKSGSTVTFTFDDNSTYLQNGTIEVPLNSLSLVIDESNMVTFKKSASNDIFVSAHIAEFGMSKSDLESWYKNNMVGSTGGGTDTGTVQTMIDESISGKADSVSAVSSAEYDSSATTINFKNIDGDIISSIDASDFVIDGMIDNVSIETISGESYLVIDFNTASGKEDIQIPISDIFDASNYYTKAEVDAITSGKVDTSAYTAYTAATETTIGNKLDASAYTPVTVSSAITYGDTNAVAGGAVFDKLTVPSDYPSSGVVLTFDGIHFSTNYPANTNRLVCDFSGASTDYINNSFEFYDSDKETIDGIRVEVEYDSGEFLNIVADGCSATTAGTVLTIEFENNDIAYLNFGDSDKITTVAYGPDVFWIKDTKQDKIIAGRGISIESGNTVSINLPLTGTSSNGIQEGFAYSYGYASHAEGHGVANGDYSHAEGENTMAIGNYSHAEGQNTITNNSSEHASGKFNNSVKASTTFGNSGNTLFSVGNGTADNARHNAFEIRQNGDIYITSGGTDIKLQDNLGGGSVTIDPTLDGGSTNPVANSAITISLNDKASKSQAYGSYSFGKTSSIPWIRYKNVSGNYLGNELYYAKINNKDILTSNSTWAKNNLNLSLVETSAVTSSMTSSSTDSEIPSAKCVYDKLGGLSLVKLTQAAYDALSPNYDPNTLYIIKD